MDENVVKKKRTSWLLIILCLILFFPVGILLWYRRWTEDKKETIANSQKVINTAWVVISFGVIYLIMTFTEKDGASYIIGFFVCVGFGLWMMHCAKSMRARGERYNRYVKVINESEKTRISDIALAVSLPANVVTKDLYEMIASDFFPGAYLDMERQEIVYGERTSIQKKPLKKGKSKIMICSGCGARNEVFKDDCKECEYCGTLISYE